MWKKIVFAAVAAVLAVGLGAMPRAGGFRDIDVNDAGARDALNFAVIQHNRGSNDLCPRKVAQVMRIQSQVVAGMNYVITVRMVKTPCRKVCGGNNVCIRSSTCHNVYQATYYLSISWVNDFTLTVKV
uniref:Cystatin-C-like n=1 Tax=Sparus aurata TaxID=8175 RepID=A0A671YNM1_SPAAU